MTCGTFGWMEVDWIESVTAQHVALSTTLSMADKEGWVYR